jgi:curved DNA-binding protein CbpA
MKTFYQLLEIAPTAGSDEIKRAFRARIARYHPDKVQHLGQEFQDLAAERAAALTEAYRILSNGQTRAEYDRSLALSDGTMPVAPAAPPSRSPSAPVHPPAPEVQPGGAHAFSRERATRDQFVRSATFNRVRRALAPLAGGYDASEVRGFDFAWLPKSRLFGRAKGPRLVGRLVSRVDSESVAGAWGDAGRWASNDDVCVFLMGAEIATAAELARAIADQRRRSRNSRVTLIPVDARTWDAHLPTDAPPIAKTVLERLKSGT